MSNKRKQGAPPMSTKDMSQLLHIPTTPLNNTSESVPPPQLKQRLFDYQLRSLTRLLSVEKTCHELVVPGVNRALASRGGVLADVGKTAQCIGLILASMDDPLSATCKDQTLVVTPTHLCAQWRNEILKFTDALNVEIVSSLSPHAMANRIADCHVVIASMEFITSGVYKAHHMNSSTTFHSIQWRRIIFDECHETILLGGENMNVLRSLIAQNVWCVSGTPFTHNDLSIYGIHQLLNIDIRLNVTNNPFAIASKSYRNEAFEYLKRVLYLRNTPDSVAAFRKTLSRAQQRAAASAEPKYDEKVILLPYTVFERSFYDERLRRVEGGSIHGNLYAPRYQSLRQLCCHPEASSDWMQRLQDIDPRANRVFLENPRSSEVGKHAVPARQEGGGLSLDQLPARMIKVKKAETNRLDVTYARIQHRIGAAQNSIKYCEAVSEIGAGNVITCGKVPGRGEFEFYDASSLLGPVTEWAHCDETGTCRFRVVDDGHFTYAHPYVGMAVLTTLAGHFERIEFVKQAKDWIASEEAVCAENRKEADRVKAEIRYFMKMVESWKNRDNEGGGNEDKESAYSSANSGENGDTAGKGEECLICDEAVTLFAVLTCGHSTCRPCLDSWFAKDKSCPQCRKEITDNEEIFMLDTTKRDEAAKSSEEAEEISNSLPPPAPVVQFVPPIVMRHGTKPAAVACFLRDALAASPNNRIIVFSKWHSMLNLLAKTLNSLSIPNLFPKTSLNMDIAQEAASASATANSNNKNNAKKMVPLSEINGPLALSVQVSDPISEFQTSDHFRVLMLSLAECASGTNLQCANMIVMLEPSSGDNSAHALATEQQAIGRAVRYGQTQRVTVVKFVVRGTIEEDLYRFQEAERAKRTRQAEGNVIHLKRVRILECNATFTETSVSVGEPCVIEDLECSDNDQDDEAISGDGVMDLDENCDTLAVEEASNPIRSGTSETHIEKRARTEASIFNVPSSRRTRISFLCPICNHNLNVNNNDEMNVHVDECLARNFE
ncbi:SNF2 family N-terminal domain-containing protein [Chytriomyces sp. MP71]|nr:SNF2 family N-terminal domain-containing protein [Chytriomyces sp. MP71]